MTVNKIMTNKKLLFYLCMPYSINYLAASQSSNDGENVQMRPLIQNKATKLTKTFRLRRNQNGILLNNIFFHSWFF